MMLLPIAAANINKISTIAGVLGSTGSTGDEGRATAAQLKDPSDIEATPDGTGLWIADKSNNAIRLVNFTTGDIATIAGVLNASPSTTGDGGKATDALLSAPSFIKATPDGTGLWIADTGNHAIRLLSFTTGLISTIAGVLGSQGSTGDGGRATDAKLNFPTGIEATPDGTGLWIADRGNAAIRLLSFSTGLISTVAGVLGSPGSTGDGGRATAAQLKTPEGIEATADGTGLWIADAGNHAIRLLNFATGNISTIAGVLASPGNSGDGGKATAAQLNSPCDIEAIPDGTGLWISDVNNHVIRFVNFPTGLISTIAGVMRSGGSTGDGGEATAAKLNSPTGIETTPDGTGLWIADRRNAAIRLVKFTTGNTAKSLSSTSLAAATSIPASITESVHSSAAISSSAWPSSSGSTYLLAGANETAASSSPESSARTSTSPSSVAVHSIVEHCTTNGCNVSTIAGVLGSYGSTGDGGRATAAKLNSPSDIEATPDGTGFWIADNGNHVIRLVSFTTGNISTIAGVLGAADKTGDGGRATAAKLIGPSRIKATPHSTGLWIADTGNNAIRLLNFTTGLISTIVGVLGSQGSTGDGGKATAAKLNSPIGIEATPDGTGLWIADRGNAAIRLLNLCTGLISTIAGVLGSPGMTGDGGRATAAQLDLPESIKAIADGTGLWIADKNNHAIRLLNFTTGLISTIAGVLGSPGSTGDGGRATAAKLYLPCGIEATADGTGLWIADGYNNAIRFVNFITGLISTIAGVLGIWSYGITGDGGKATAAKLYYPQGIEATADGAGLWIADMKNHAIRQLFSAKSLNSTSSAASVPAVHSSAAISSSAWPSCSGSTYLLAGTNETAASSRPGSSAPTSTSPSSVAVHSTTGTLSSTAGSSSASSSSSSLGSFAFASTSPSSVAVHSTTGTLSSTARSSSATSSFSSLGFSTFASTSPSSVAASSATGTSSSTPAPGSSAPAVGSAAPQPATSAPSATSLAVSVTEAIVAPFTVTVQGSIALTAGSPSEAAALIADPKAKAAIQQQVAATVGVPLSQVTVNLTLVNSSRRLDSRQLSASQILATYIISLPAASAQAAATLAATVDQTLASVSPAAFTTAVTNIIATTSGANYGITVSSLTVTKMAVAAKPTSAPGTSTSTNFTNFWSSGAIPPGQQSRIISMLLMAAAAAYNDCFF